jgi:hypothetical protein
MRDFVLGLVRVLAVAFFAFVAFIIWSVVADEMRHDMESVEMGWHCLLRMVGGIVAVVALVELVVEALRRGLSRHLVPWTTALLGGVLLIGAHWAVALSLGGVAAAVVVKEGFGRPAVEQGEPPESEKP